MHFIPKLYIQNNLPNSTKCETICFFLYSNNTKKRKKEK